MTISARVEMGDWANQVSRLREATGWTMEQVIRQQSKLLVRDCILMTPPCERQLSLRRYQLAKRVDEQMMIGKKAIARDVMKIFVPHDSRKVFSVGRKPRQDKLAQQLAKIAITGDVEKLNKTLIAAGYATTASAFSKVAKTASLQDHKDRRGNDGKIRWRGNRVLIHDGNAQPYNPAYDQPTGWQTNPGISDIVNKLSGAVGTAKAGWFRAAKMLKLGFPRALGKVKRKDGGIASIEGAGTDKVAITVGSTVPYMQRVGSTLRIVERAWEQRKRDIKLQASITKYGRARGMFLKGGKITTAKAPAREGNEA